MSERANPDSVEHKSPPVGRPRLTVVGTPIAFIYFVVVGGSQVGELIGWLRVVNAILAAALIIVYFRYVPRMDRIDRLVALALILFVASAMLSDFRRQSFDAALAGLSYAALFTVGRRLLERRATRTSLMWGMRLLAAAVIVMTAARASGPILEWWALTEYAVLPPIGLPIDGRPWGHPYDVALLALMLYPSWWTEAPGRSRSAVALLLGLILVFVVMVLGSRAIWLAIAGATVALGLVWLVRRRPRARGIPALLVTALAATAAAVMGGPLVDRLLTTSTVEQRVAMWSSATSAWLERPLAGYGPGSFPWILQTTDYFETNSLHPRHPDSAIFQLLPELGLLGVTAAACLLAAIVVPMLRHGSGLLPLWPLGVFVLAGVGANPTDFAFLVVPAIIWAAWALPCGDAKAMPSSPMRRRTFLVATSVGLGLVAVAYGATLAAGVLYDSAIRHFRDGSISAVHANLSAAMRLDPGMALYARQRGVAGLLLGDSDGAVRDLSRATRINPSDDLAWRALAIAHDANGNRSAARDTLAQAVNVQRSDPTNLLLHASWLAMEPPGQRLDAILGEALLAWPSIVGAPRWQDLLADTMTTERAIDLALQRWETGGHSPVPLRGQPFDLAVLDGNLHLIAALDADQKPSDALVAATAAVHWCLPEAPMRLDAVPNEDRRSSRYWELVVRHAAEQGRANRAAQRLYQLRTGRSPEESVANSHLEPLQENNSRGSVDAWGYDRLTIPWQIDWLRLPSPRAGSDRWLIEPSDARRELAWRHNMNRCLP